MTDMTAQTLATTTGATLVARGARAITAGLTTDSRAVSEGCIFLALKGEKFDGNSFAAAASQQAAAVVVSRVEGDYAPDCAVLLVEDTLTALHKIALWQRQQLEPLHVVGITGSSGKTSVKDMTRAVLATRFATTATKGNLNNHIGVPLSILSTPAGTQAAVWEMGMNHAGELAPLCALTQPQVGIISHIGSAHIGLLGSRDAIAEEKCTLARCLPADGWMLYPATDDYADYIATQTKAQPLPVGGAQSLVRAANVQSTPQGSTYTLIIEGLGEAQVSLPIPGAHMVTNSLLAAAAGWKLGCSLAQIAEGLSSLTLNHGRLACKEVAGYTIVDDTYNANPESMAAALRTVAELRGHKRHIAVLGKMGELGEAGIPAHADVGWCAASLGYAAVIVTGEECAETLAMCHAAAESVPALLVNTPAEAAAALRRLAEPGDAILFKGSRSAGMERVIAEFTSSLSS